MALKLALALILALAYQILHGDGHFVRQSRSLFTDDTAGKDEDVALAEFHELVDHLAYREFMKSDGYLMRWLAETNFDAYEAAERFSKFVDWRRANEVDSIVFEDFSVIDEGHVMAINLVDKDGRLGIYIPFGSYNIRKITMAGAEELYQRYMIRMYELCEIYMQQLRAGPRPNITQMVAIYDLAGFNLKLGGCFKCVSMIPKLVSNFDSNYPGLFYKAFVINTPTIFHNLLQLGMSFMSENQRESLVIFGYHKSEWMPALHEQFALDQLPTEFGGLKPSFHSKSSMGVQLNFLADLLQEARAVVRRDMKNYIRDHDHDDDSDHESLELTTLATLNTNTSVETEKPTETNNKKHRHHHHYRMKKDCNTSISVTMAGRRRSSTSSGSDVRLFQPIFVLFSFYTSYFVLRS